MAKEKENGTRQPAISQEYVDDSSSESNSEASSEREEGSKNRSRPATKSASQSEQNKKSESGQSSDGSDSEQSSSKKRQLESSRLVTEPQKKKSKLNAFAPPPGYFPIRGSQSALEVDVEKMFSKLDDKQVWHITAPASVSLESIQSFDMAAAVRGEPILHRNGTDYNLFAIPSKGETLLLPVGKDSVYTKAKAHVSRSFHLREVLHHKLDEVETNPSTEDETSIDSHLHDQKFFASIEGAKKPARKQPPGLLMRYQPYGKSDLVDTPYQLPRPEVDDDNEREVLQEEAKDINGSQKTSKKERSEKKSRKNKTSHEYNVENGDLMDVDTDDRSGSVATPRSKARAQNSTPESGKRHKKDRKERRLT